VKGYLLDTNIAIRAATYPERLSREARRAIDQGPVFLSVLCYWEVLIKSMKGKLDIGDPRVWWPEIVDQLAATILPIRPDHIGQLAYLPPLHSDPFDRALIAQARAEDLTLVTSDGAIAKYAGPHLRILN
jgi:PIN domain nuclease of toxin-antitoxin system